MTISTTLQFVCWDKARPFVEEKGGYWLSGYYGLIQAMNYFQLDTYFASPTASAIFATSVLGITAISVAYSFKRMIGLLTNRDISYGVYLWHMPIIWTMIKFGYAGTWAYAALAYGLTISIAALSWVAIERPALRGKMKSRKEDKPSITAAAKSLA